MKAYFCSNLRARKQEIIQNKITENKIKENINSKKEDIEFLIIENFNFKKSIYFIYLIVLGSIFLYGFSKYFAYPIESKESTDSYCMLVNSLNCLNALIVILNKTFKT